MIHRGNQGRVLFRDSADYPVFMESLGESSRAGSVDIWAYVLMRNHVHVIAVPQDRDSLPVAMDACLADYEARFAARHGASGILWHGRSYAAMIPLPYLWDAVRYVERNPVRARIVERAEDYPWSSASYHCGLRDDDPLVRPASPLKGALDDWSRWLREPDRDGHLAYLRRRAVERQPGNRNVGVLESALDRRIQRGQRGPAKRQSWRPQANGERERK